MIPLEPDGAEVSRREVNGSRFNAAGDVPGLRVATRHPGS